jgi:SAM-dependent methyltransferase
VPPTSNSARATAPPDAEHPTPRLLRRRVRLARRHLGPGPYLDYGCGRGELLAFLADWGSAAGFAADPALAELARTAAPGCPVHTNPEALPASVFRGVLAMTTTPPDAVTLATWRRVLVPRGRVLVVGVAPDHAEGFALRWAGREGWRRGVAVVVLEAAAGPEGG